MSCLLATACNGGLGDDENNPTPSIPKIELSQQTIDVDFEPNTYTISVTSPYYWKAESDNEWIVVKSEKGDAGTEKLSFTVERNENENERKGTIFIYNSPYNLVAELNVIQKAFEPEISIDTETLNFTFEGGKEEVAITANFEYEVAASADWITFTKTENGITVTVSPYEETTGHSADIVISSEKYDISKTIKVTQTGLTEECYARQIIRYTSSDGNIITPCETDVFGASIISNTYENGEGIILFNTPVTSIGEWAFSGCSSLTSVTIGNSVTSIGNSAFADCSSLTSVTIPDSVTSIGEWAFSGCSSLTSITIPDSVTSIGGWTFFGCSSLTSVTIPNSVTSIGEGAFCECTSLTSITIPDSVTSIGSFAFSDCRALTSVTIPDSVTSIGDSAFHNCRSLTSITIPDSVTSIGEGAFCECTSLTSITIPDSVTSIGEGAFCDCTSLTSIYCKPTTPPSGGNYMFDNNASGRKIYVPQASVEAYKSAQYWSNYADYIVGYDF